MSSRSFRNQLLLRGPFCGDSDSPGPHEFCVPDQRRATRVRLMLRWPPLPADLADMKAPPVRHSRSVCDTILPRLRQRARDSPRFDGCDLRGFSSINAGVGLAQHLRITRTSNGHATHVFGRFFLRATLYNYNSAIFHRCASFVLARRRLRMHAQHTSLH